MSAYAFDTKLVSVNRAGAVFNPNASAHSLEWTIREANLKCSGTIWRMAPSGIDAEIVVGEKSEFKVE